MNERDRFVRGTQVGTLLTMGVGLAAFGAWRLWGWALGFASGALVSLVSFRLIAASVSRLGDRPRVRPRRRQAWWAWSLLRLLGAVGLLGLVIRYVPVNLLGVALGLVAAQVGMGGYLIARSCASGGRGVAREEPNP